MVRSANCSARNEVDNVRLRATFLASFVCVSVLFAGDTCLLPVIPVFLGEARLLVKSCLVVFGLVRGKNT